MLAQRRDHLLAEQLDAAHRRLVWLFAFARPEGQIARIGAVDDVLEFLDDRLRAAGDDEAGADSSVVAALGHPTLPGHVSSLGLLRHVAGRCHPFRMRPAAGRAGRAGPGAERRLRDAAAAPDDRGATVMVAAHLIGLLVGIHYAGVDEIPEML